MKFDESLLTAYLDGELTEEERVVVERQLAQSAAHREMLRELAQLQQQLSALPAESFSTDVVAEVRRRIAAGPVPTMPAPHEVHPTAGADAAGTPGPPAELGRRGSPTPVDRSEGGSLQWRLWVPLALAAGVLAVVGLSLLRQPVEVATSEGASRAPGVPAPGDAMQLDLPQPAADRPAPLDAASEPAAPAAADGLGRAPAEVSAELAMPSRGDDRQSNARGAAVENGPPPAADAAPLALRQETGRAPGGMGGAAAGAALPSPTQTTPLPTQATEAQWGDLSERLPEGTRLYRFSTSGEQAFEQRGKRAGEQLAERPALARTAPAPLVKLQVPAGGVAETLDWLSERLTAGWALEESTVDAAEPAGSEAATLAAADAEAADEVERPAAVLVEGSPERIGQLLDAARARVAARYGVQPPTELQRDGEPQPDSELALWGDSDEAYGDGAAIILIEPIAQP